MKALITIALSVLALNARADFPDYEGQAEDRFAQQSALEAYQDGRWEKSWENIHIPGSSTWFNPKSLCVDGNSIRTEQPVQRCTAWEGRNNDDEKVIVYSRLEADDLLRNATCVQSTGVTYSTPMSYTEKRCGEWEYTDDGDRKTTNSISKAREENGTCTGYYDVQVNIDRLYNIYFYRPGNDSKNDRLLGSHQFYIRSCNALEPVPAN